MATACSAVARIFGCLIAKLGDFRIWSIGFAVLLALLQPKAFSWISPMLVQWLLFVLFFLLGVTAEPADFQACLQRRRPIAINLLMCFVFHPVMALVLGKALGLSHSLLVGTVLLGSVSSGASANLFTLLAGGDVALSVVMTTFTMIAAVMATPCVLKVMLGSAIPVNAQFVLLPIFLGVSANMVAPSFFARLKPIIPALVGTMAVPLSGTVVVQGAGPMLAVGLSLHAVVILLHAASGTLGYMLAKYSGSSEQECRALAFTAGVKHVALASVLASVHFEDQTVQVPSAASCIWCPILCSAMANIWKAHPPDVKGKRLKRTGDVHVDFCVEEYQMGA